MYCFPKKKPKVREMCTGHANVVQLPPAWTLELTHSCCLRYEVQGALFSTEKRGG